MARAFVGLLLFAASVSAGPLGFYSDSETCALQCPKTSKIVFEQGNLYKYDYESEIKTHVSGASEDHSSLHLEATVNVYVLSKCDFILKLTDVVLKDSNKDATEDKVTRWQEFSRKLEMHPLRFAYLDGQIADLCPPTAEDTWSLNVKRGILSSLQNVMPDLEKDHKIKETDIAGSCDSDYTFISKGNTIKVKKVKDILGCTDRHHYEGQIQGVPYDTHSKVQSLPIMKTSHECEHEIDSNGKFLQSNCEEKHTFRPFSKHQAGAVTEIQHKLTYLTHSTGTMHKPAIGRRTNLLYEHVLNAEESSEKREEVGSIMTKICAGVDKGVKPEVPELFMKLVKTLKTLDSTTLQAVYEDISGPSKPCDNAEKFYRDAIPVLNTPGSMAVIRKLITDKVVKETEADMWATSVAFIPKPSQKMLEELSPILEMDPPMPKAALGISSMVHNYCRKTTDCENDSIVNRIVTKLESHLNRDCSYKTDKDYEKVVMALKSIGNMGFATRAVSTVNRCILNKEMDMQIRVMAVQAFRRMGCDADRSDIMTVFSEPENDSELRINAYLALMQCPSKITIERAAFILSKEEVNQVGSFVWTHLMNLKETSDPLKQKVKAIMQDVTLEKKFNIDKRKYSRNVEWSLFSEMINTGAQVESNLLWSPKSFIPRSASANLTVDVFGTSLNLLDIGGRVEGLESIMDHYLEPSKKKKTKEEPPSDVKNLDNKYKVTKPEHPSASYYLRIFGNEIRYEDLRNIEASSMKEKMNYLQWLIDLAKNHDYDITKNMMLMDSSMVIPTITGLPLKLNLEGATTMNVKISGRLDMRTLFAAPRSADIYGQVRPSAAVEIIGNMGVDAGVAQSGLKMKSTLHTSTVIDGKIFLKNDKNFNFEWNLPEESMEVFSVDTKFYTVYKDSDREQKMISKDRYVKSKCYSDKITGLEVCGHIELPPFYTPNGPLFPFTGPAKFKVNLNKKDTYTGFHFETRFLQEKVKENDEIQVKDIARVSFNTPGSKVDRELTFDLSLNRAKRDLHITLRSPWKKMDFSGSLSNTAELRRIKGRLVVDNSKEYGFLSELSYTKKGPLTVVTPTVQFIMPGYSMRTLSGEISYEHRKNYNAKLSITNVFNRPVKVSAKVSNVRGNRFSVNMDMRSPILILKVNGFTTQGAYRATSLDISYKTRTGKKETVYLKNKLQYRLDKNSRIKGSNTLTFSAYPELNSDFTYELKKGAKVALANAKFGFGEKFNNHAMIISLINKDLSTMRVTHHQFSGKFLYPEMRIDRVLKVNHRHTKKNVMTNAEFTYATGKKMKYDMKLQKTDGPLMKIHADIALNYPGRTFQITEILQQKSEKRYENSLTFTVDPYEKMVVNTTYVKNAQHEVTTHAKIFKLKPVYLQVKFNEDLKDLKAGVDMAYGKEEYKVDVANKIKTNNAEKEIEINFDVVAPNKRFTTDAKVKKTMNDLTHDIKTAWKYGQSNSKLYTSAGKITLSKTPTLYWKITGDKNMKIELDMDGKYENSGWHASNRLISTNIKIKSTIPKFETIMVSLSHEKKGQENAVELKAYWPPKEKITAKFTMTTRGWTNWRTTVAMETPFEMMKQLSHTSEFELGKGSVEYMSRMEVNKRKYEMKFEGKANLQEHLVEGSVALKTPYPEFRDISLIVSHKDDMKVFNSLVSLKWAPGKVMQYKLVMNHAKNGWDINSNGEISITTPFEGYKMSKITWNHVNTKSSTNSRLDVDIVGNQASVYLKGGMKEEMGKKDISLEANLKTPWEMLKDLTVKINHQHKLGTYEDMVTSGSVEYAPNKVIEVTSEAHYKPGEAMVKRIKFTSPFKGYHMFTLDVDNRFDGNKYTTHKEVKWATNKKIALDGELVRDSPYEFTSKFRLSTPYDNMERMLLIVNNKKQKKLWVTDMNVEYGSGQKVVAQTRFQWASYKRLGFTFESPFKNMQSLGLELKHKGRLRKFQATASFDYEPFGGPVSGAMKVDTMNLNRIIGKMTIRSPFKTYNPIIIQTTHTRSAKSGYTTFAAFTFARKKYVIDNSLLMKGWNDINHKMTVSWAPKKNIETETKFSMKNGVKGSIDVTTPVESMKKLSLAFSHDGVLKNFKNDVSVTYNDMRYTSKNEFVLEWPKVHAKAMVTTPHSTYKKLTFMVDHDGTLSKFKNDVSFIYPMNTYSTRTEFEFAPEIPNLNFKLNLKTPIRNFRNINMALSHKGPLRGFATDMLFEYPRNTFKSHAELTYNQIGGENIDVKFSLETPYTRPMSIVASHKGPSFIDCTTDVTAMYGLKKYEFQQIFKRETEKYTSKTLLKTPIAGFEKITVDLVNIYRAGEYLKTDVKLNYPQNKYAMVMELSMSNDINWSMTVTTPIPGYEKILLSLKKSGTLKKFDVEVLFEMKDKNTLGVKFDMLKKISGEVTATIPYLKMVNNMVGFKGEPGLYTATVNADVMGEKMMAGIKFNGILTNFQSSAWYQWKEKNEINVKYMMEENKISGEVLATIPYIKMVSNMVKLEYTWTPASYAAMVDANVMDENINAGVKTKLSWIDFQNSVWFQRKEKYEIDMKYKRVGTKGTGEIRATIPYWNMVNDVISMEYDGKLSDLKVNMEAEILERKITGDFQYKIEPSKFEMSSTVEIPDKTFAVAVTCEPMKSRLSITTPYEKLKSLILHYEVDGQLKDFNAHGSIELNGEVIATTMKYRMVELQYNIGMTLKTPFAMLKDFEVELEHSGPLKNFETTMTVTLNGKKATLEIVSDVNTEDWTLAGKITVTNQIKMPFTAMMTWNDKFTSWINMKMDDTYMLTFDGKKATFNNLISLKDMVLETKMELINPFIKPVTADLIVKLTPSWTNLKYDISGELNGKKFKFAGGLLLAAAKATASMQLTTPFEQIPSATVKITHTGTWDNFVEFAEIKVNEKTVIVDGKFSIKLEKITGNFRVSTPFEILKTVSVTFSHEGGLVRKVTTGEMQLNGVKFMDMNTFIRPVEKLLTGKFYLNLPFVDYEISASVNHKGPLNAFDNQLQMILNGKKIMTQTKFSQIGYEINGYFKLENPWYQAVIVQMKNSGIPISFANSASVEIGSTRYAASSEYKKIANTIEAMLNVELPYAMLPNIKIAMKHDGLLSNFVNNVGLEYGLKKIASQIKYKKFANLLEGSVTLTTPYDYMKKTEMMVKFEKNLDSYKVVSSLETGFPYLKDVAVNIDHKGSLRDFTNKVQMTWNEKKFVQSTTLEITKGLFTINSATNTPYEILSFAEIGIKHKMVSMWNMDLNMIAKATVSGKPVNAHTTFSIESNSIKSEAVAKWGSTPRESFQHKMTMTKSVQFRRNEVRTYGMEWELTSYPLTFDADVKVQSTDNTKNTEIMVTYNKETLTLKNSITMMTVPEPGLTYDLRIIHPKLTKDVHFVTTVTYTEKKWEGSTNLEYAAEKFFWQGKLVDESTTTLMKHSAELLMTHSPSDLNMAFITSLSKEDDSYIQTDTQWRYLTAYDKKMKNNILRAEINKIKRSLSLEIVNPMMDLQVTGRKTMADVDKGIHHYSLATKLNKKQILGTELDINQPEGKVEMIVNVKDMKTTMIGNCNEDNLKMSVTSEGNGRETKDIEVTANLKDNLMNTQIYVRPTIFLSVKSALSNIHMPDLSEVTSAIEKEFEMKKKYILQALDPILPYIRMIIDKLSQNVYVQRLMAWATNVMEKMVKIFSEMQKMLIDWGRNASEYIVKMYEEGLKMMVSKLKEIFGAAWYKVQEISNYTYRKAQYYSKTMATTILKSCAVIRKYMSESPILEAIKKKIQPYQEKITKYFNDIVVRIKEHPIYKNLMEKWNNFQKSRFYVFLTDWKDAFKTMYDRAVVKVTKMSDSLMRKFRNNPNVKEIRKYVNQMVAKAKQVIKEYDFPKYLRIMSKNGIMAFRNRIYKIFNAYLHMDQFKMSANTKTGHYEFQVFLPVRELRNMKQLMHYIPDMPATLHLDLKKPLMAIKDSIAQYLPDDDWTLADIYYTIKQYTKLKNWIPVFHAQGRISGQHISTFDQRFYDFLGENRYMLARDFADGDFAIIANYEKVGDKIKKSVEVIVGSNRFKIEDGEVKTTNGKIINLPYTSPEVNVLHKDNHIVLETTKGVTVDCDTVNDDCKVKIPIRYFGRTAGLLGNYNHEQYDDMIMSDKAKTTDIETFTRSWCLGRRCRVVNYARKSFEIDAQTGICHKYFMSERSPLRACFKQVDPKPYRNMCMNDVSAIVTAGEKDICGVIKMYRDECKDASVTVELPTECVTCSMPSGKPFSVGRDVTLKDSSVPRSADVVFVMQHARCNKVLTLTLDKIVRFMDKTLAKDGLVKNKYGLVGFGGEGVYSEPHSHTMRGKLMNNKYKFVVGTFPAVSDNPSDALKAVEFASKYPFRAGVSKSIILIKCTACEEKTVTTSNVLSELKDQDIHLHILQPEDITAKTSGPASVIFGVTNKLAFTQREMNGDEQLRHLVTLPNDKCNSLAADTDGAIFDSKKLYLQRRRISKDVLDIFNKQVALRAKPASCQICKCVVAESGAPRSVCHPCEGSYYTPVQVPLVRNRSAAASFLMEFKE